MRGSETRCDSGATGIRMVRHTGDGSWVSIVLRARTMARLRVKLHDAAGQAMILALALMLVVTVVPIVIYTGLSSQVPEVLMVQNSKAALAAAQTGVANYVSLLTQDISNSKYGNASCSVPSGSQWTGFYLTSPPCPNPQDTITSPLSGWAPVPGSSSAGVGMDEGYEFTVNASTTQGLITIVSTGRAGPLNAYQYRTVQVSFQNPALSYAYFTNYETSSPFAYTDSTPFTLMSWALGLVSKSNSVPASIKSTMQQMLGSGPVGATKLAYYFCNYHAYDTNMILKILDSSMVPTMLDSYLKQYLSGLGGLASFSLFGAPIGQDLYNAIVTEVNSLIASVQQFLGKPYGPFPLLCSVNNMYNGYYGLTTNISGKAYANDSLYTCSPTGSLSNLKNANVYLGNTQATELPQYKSSASGPPDSYNPNLSIGNDLFNWTWSVNINLIIKTVSWSIPIFQGCANVTPGPNVTTESPVTPPVPDFSTMRSYARPSEDGCTYYGPTFIQLNGSSFQAWSPNTPTGSCPTNGKSAPLPTSGVIYVRNVQPNQSCVGFSSSSIVPEVGSNQSLPFGLDNLIQHHSCMWGDAIVQGTLSGRLTIGASNDIMVSGNIVYSCASNGGKTIPNNCSDILGLAPGGNLPLSSSYAPATDSSGTYYPQGNVVVIHPVVGGQNSNNCPVGNVVNGTSYSPGGATDPCASWLATSPNRKPVPPISPPGPPHACSVLNLGNCMELALYDMATWAYQTEYQDFCGVSVPSSGPGSVADPETSTPASEANCTSGSLEDNWASSNTNAPPPPQPPSPSSILSCNSWNITLNIGSLLSGNWNGFISQLQHSCGYLWLKYYIGYGAMGLSAGIQDVCSIFGINPCNAGYETQLQSYESTWVHGPVNPFPSVYNPVVDALILASNSSPLVSPNQTVTKTLKYPDLPIVNGSFTLQNVTQGNEYATSPGYSGTHGLGTLTVAGSVVEQYANSLQNAGLSSLNHFEFLRDGLGGLSSSDCNLVCFVPSGFQTVNFSYDPAELFNPPPHMLSSVTSPWTPLAGTYREIKPSAQLPR